MRKFLLQIFAVSTVACGVLISNPALHAEDSVAQSGSNSETESSDQNDDSGEKLCGSASTEAEAPFSVEPGAPAGFGGSAQLRAQNCNGTIQAWIKLEPEGLPAGTYTASITKKSDGSVVVLGTFDVAAANSSSDDVSDDSESESESEDTEIVYGTPDNPLPAGFNPLDVATVAISDANGNIIGRANLTDSTQVDHADFHASVKTTAGADDADAAGRLLVSAKAKRGTTRGVLQLVAGKLPKSTDVMLNLNGSDLLGATTNGRGQLKLTRTTGSSGRKPTKNQLPQGTNLFSLHTLILHDNAGHELLKAKF